MRTSLLLLTSFSLGASLRAQITPSSTQSSPGADPTTIVTTWGKEYDNIKVTKVDPDGIHISYPLGVAKIPFKQLSPELQKKYGYNPVAAKQFEDAQAQAEAQVDAEQAPKIAAELAQEKQQAFAEHNQRLAEVAAEKSKENAEIAADQARILKQQMKDDSYHGYQYRGYGRSGDSGTYWNDRRESDQAALAAANAQANIANQQQRSAEKAATLPTEAMSQPRPSQQIPPYVMQPQVQQQGNQPPTASNVSSTTTVVTTTTTTTTRQVSTQTASDQANLSR